MKAPSYNNHPRLYKGLETDTEKIKRINEWLDWLNAEIAKAANGHSEYQPVALLKKHAWFIKELRKVESRMNPTKVGLTPSAL